jgi:hypothetical protein
MSLKLENGFRPDPKLENIELKISDPSNDESNPESIIKIQMY